MVSSWSSRFLRLASESLLLLSPSFDLVIFVPMNSKSDLEMEAKTEHSELGLMGAEAMRRHGLTKSVLLKTDMRLVCFSRVTHH